MEVLGVGPDETWMVDDNLEWEIVAPPRMRPDRIIRRLSELLL
jgi:FMN phosphatase YigB (HAD superfamily)